VWTPVTWTPVIRSGWSASIDQPPHGPTGLPQEEPPLQFGQQGLNLHQDVQTGGVEETNPGHVEVNIPGAAGDGLAQDRIEPGRTGEIERTGQRQFVDPALPAGRPHQPSTSSRRLALPAAGSRTVPVISWLSPSI
jgi:hypothetical protein